MPPRRHKDAPTPALDALTGIEPARLLAELLDAHPELRLEAEQAARRLFDTVDVEGVADDVAWALEDVSLEDLASRSGRVRGRGYVHETDGAWELVSEAVEPFMIDLRRRSRLGLMDAAAAVTMGIVAGLYQVREPEEGTVVAYAGPDALSDLAEEALKEAARLGVVVPSQAPDDYWPQWPELS